MAGHPSAAPLASGAHGRRRVPGADPPQPLADAYAGENRRIGSEPDLWFATAALEVTYLKPAPIAPLTLRARVEERPPQHRVACALFAGDDERAHGTVVAVRVPPAWRG